MKRRDILKVLPAPLIAGKTLAIPVQEGQSRRRLVSQALAEVKSYNGTPTLFLGGKLAFAGMYWVAVPEAGRWRFTEQAALNARTGIHIYALEAGKGCEWLGHGNGSCSEFVFPGIEGRLGAIIKADSEVCFHLRCYPEIDHGDWWEAK